MKRGDRKTAGGKKHEGARAERSHREHAERPKRHAEDLSALKEKAAKADEYYESLLRLKAEFENFRKRIQREKAEWLLQANQELMLELLPVIDSFELGLESARKTKDFDKLLEGLELALSELLQVLGKFGLEQVKAAGKQFDPNFHEAVTLVDTDSHEGDAVVDEIRKGYFLNNKLLRPSMVTVARTESHQIPPGKEGPVETGKEKGEGRHG